MVGPAAAGGRARPPPARAPRSRPGPPGRRPGAAFREVLAEPPEHWAWDWATTASREERALLSAAVEPAGGRGGPDAGAVAAADATHAGRRPPWTHPTRPFRLIGGIDATLGKRDGGHTIVVVLTGDHVRQPRIASPTRRSSSWSPCAARPGSSAGCCPMLGGTGPSTSTTACRHRPGRRRHRGPHSPRRSPRRRQRPGPAPITRVSPVRTSPAVRRARHGSPAPVGAVSASCLCRDDAGAGAGRRPPP